MGGESEDTPKDDKNGAEANPIDQASFAWAERAAAQIEPFVRDRTPVDLQFRPVGVAYDQIELTFKTQGIAFEGRALVHEVETSLGQTGYPTDLWLTLVGREWPALILECSTMGNGAVHLFLELQDLILFLPFEKRSDGNRPLNLLFYPPDELGVGIEKDISTDTEPEMYLDQIDQTILTRIVWEDESENEEDLAEEGTATTPMPVLQPVKRPQVRLRGRPDLTIDDEPFYTCVEITALQTKATINEAVLKKSLARAAGCSTAEIAPLAMTHAVDELVILVRLPDEQRVQRFLTYFSYHQAKLGDQMQVASYISLHPPRRWVWRQLVNSGSFNRQNGRLSFSH